MAGKTDFSKLNSDIAKRTEEAEARQKKGGGAGLKFEKVEWGKVPFGDTTLMILPPSSEEVDFYEEVFVHHNFKNSKGEKRSYLCSKKKHGACPVCDRHAKLVKEGLEKEAFQIRAQKTFLYNGLDMNGNLKVWGLKPSQHNEIIQEINAYHADEGIDATQPINGKQIKISRLKVSPWARAKILGKKVEMSEQKISEVLSKLHTLSKCYIDNTPEELAKMLNGEDINLKARKDAGVEPATENPTDDDDTTPTQGAAVPTTAAVITSNPPATPTAEAKKRGRPATAAPAVEVAGTEEEDPELAKIMASLEE